MTPSFDQPIVTAVRPNSVAPSLTQVVTFGPFPTMEHAERWAADMERLLPAEWIFATREMERLLPPSAAVLLLQERRSPRPDLI